MTKQMQLGDKTNVVTETGNKSKMFIIVQKGEKSQKPPLSTTEQKNKLLYILTMACFKLIKI